MTTPEDPGNGTKPGDTRPVDVKGREISVRQLNDAQLLLLGRESRLGAKDGTSRDRKMAAIARVFDILESVVVKEEDKEYLMDLTVAGNLELKDMMDFINAFSADDEEKPKVRRGRYATKRT